MTSSEPEQQQEQPEYSDNPAAFKWHLDSLTLLNRDSNRKYCFVFDKWIGGGVDFGVNEGGVAETEGTEDADEEVGDLESVREAALTDERNEDTFPGL